MTRTPSVAAPLGDFTADMRIVRLVIMAALIGVISAFVALGLVRLIGLFTNLAYFHRIAGTLASPADSQLGLWVLPIPVLGGLVVGLMARFGTPGAAALLAVELLLFEWKPRSFIPVACAAAVAAAVRVPLLGSGPLFPVTPHALLAWPELLAALGLGIVAGFGSGLLTWLVYAYEDLFRKLPIHWMWWPLLGGAVVGLGGLLYPRALGVGYDTINDLLTGRLVGMALLGLMLTKAVIWAAAL